MTREERDELIANNLELVARAVNTVMRRYGLPNGLRDELKGAGNVGLLEAASRFEPERGVPFVAYAISRVRGAVLDAVRSQATTTAHEGPLLDEVVSEHPGPERLLAAREGARELLANIDALPEKERRLMRACYGEGLTLSEFAKREGISKGWVSRLHDRGLETLKHSEQRTLELER